MDEGNGKEQEKRTAASPSNQLGFATAPSLLLLLGPVRGVHYKNAGDYRFFECWDSVGDSSIVINIFIIPSSHD